MNLVFSEIIRNLFMLKDETLERENFLEGDLHGDGGLIYKARVTIVLGALAALEMYLQSENEKYVLDKKLLELVKQNIQFIWFWGESAFPYFFSLIKYLELNNEDKIAKELLNGIFLFILNLNSPRKNRGIPSPYYSAGDVIEAIFKIDLKKIDLNQFSGGSYSLGPIILMLARRGERELLEKSWRRLSHIQLKEFRPDNIEDTFLWHADSGSNQTEFPKPTQSWASLVKEAHDLDEVPKLYREYSNLLKFFTLACPHRVNKQTIIVLDWNH